MALCTVEHVSKRYDEADAHPQVNDVSLEVDAGDFVSISGQSGAGKSTLLMIMGGLLRPTSGTVSIDGIALGTAAESQRGALRRLKLGYVFQSSTMVQALTVAENIRFAARTAGLQLDDQQVCEAAAQMGLEGKLDVLPSRLSGGQRRRAMIAATLAKNPQLVLADEPTNDLDQHWAHVVMQAFAQYASSGGAVVVVTHSSITREYANRFFTMSYGALAPQGHGCKDEA